MKVRPITYSPAMIRAKRELRKDQTRRIVNPKPELDGTNFFLQGRFTAISRLDATQILELCPYGVPGDQLWVREQWRTESRFDHLKPSELPESAMIWYLADGPAPGWCGRFRHARFMPRCLSRDLDEVVSVRLERVLDISENDAVAEGMLWSKTSNGGNATITSGWGWGEPGSHYSSTARDAYVELWEKLHGRESRRNNPWVWVIGFKNIKTSRTARWAS